MRLKVQKDHDGCENRRNQESGKSKNKIQNDFKWMIKIQNDGNKVEKSCKE